MLEAGLLTAIGIIFLLCRLNLKRVAGYRLPIDVVLFGVLTWMFIGTYAGMVTGLMAGVIISVFLTGVKRTVGAERLKLVRKDDEAFPRARWREVK
jgi:hypothetical protein